MSVNEKFCQVIARFEIDDFQKLKRFFPLGKSSLYTNNPLIKESMRNAGYIIKEVWEHAGYRNHRCHSINEQSYQDMKALEKSLSDLTFCNAKLFDGLRFHILQTLDFLNRVKAILEEENRVIFIFSDLQYFHFCIPSIANELGVKTSGVYQIGEKLDLFNFDHSLKKNTNLLLEKIKLHDANKLQNNRVNNDIEYRASVINFRINPISEHALFCITNQMDLFLKPIYPVLQEFKRNKIDFSVFTFDDMTSEIISDRKFKEHNLFNYYDDLLFPVSRNKWLMSIRFYRKIRYRVLPRFYRKIKYRLVLRFYRKIKYRLVLRFYRKIKYRTRSVKFFKIRRKKLRRLYHKIKYRLVPRFYYKIRYRILRKIYEEIRYRILRKIYEEIYSKEAYINLEFESMKLSSKQVFIAVVAVYLFPSLKKRLQTRIEQMDLFLNKISFTEMQVIKKFFDAGSSVRNNVILKSYATYIQNDRILRFLIDQLYISAIVNGLFNKFRFKSVFVAVDGSPYNSLVCSIARRHNIPTFSAPASFAGHSLISTSIMCASKICVPGPLMKEEFKQLHVNEERVVITGAPRFDYVASNSTSLKRYDEPKQMLILVAMSRWHDNDEIWISDLIKFCNNSNLRIFIKIHPVYKYSDRLYVVSEEKIMSIEQKCKGLKYKISYDAEIAELLPKTAIVITDYSMTGLEASLHDIPIIEVNMSKEPLFDELSIYAKKGIALHADNMKELIDAINKVLTDNITKTRLKEERARFNYAFNYLNDGKASQRILDLITKGREQVIYHKYSH